MHAPNKNINFEPEYLIKEQKKTSKKSGKKKSTHLLSDLIQFDDVEDDDLWFEEGVEEAELQRKATKNIEDEYDEITAADFVIDEDSSQSANVIDTDTKTEAFRHIIAGACMSMGLKFAGSFNQEAYETLASVCLF